MQAYGLWQTLAFLPTKIYLAWRKAPYSDTLSAHSRNVLFVTFEIPLLSPSPVFFLSDPRLLEIASCLGPFST